MIERRANEEAAVDALGSVVLPVLALLAGLVMMPRFA